MSGNKTIRRALYISKQRHGYQDGGFPTFQPLDIYDPYRKPTASGAAPLLNPQLYSGVPMEGSGSAFDDGNTGPGISSQPESPISSSTSYTLGPDVSDSSQSQSSQSSQPSQNSQSSQTSQSTPSEAKADTSWTGSLATTSVSPASFAENTTATMLGPNSSYASFGPSLEGISAPNIGKIDGFYGALSQDRSGFVSQQSQQQQQNQEQQENQESQPSDENQGNIGGTNLGGGWGDDSDNQSSDNSGEGGDGGDGGGGDGGGSGGDSGGDGGGGGGGGGDGEKRGGRIYPLRHHKDWEEAHDYEKTGGKLTHMSPDSYLARVKPLNMDHDDKHLIHHFKKQITKGEKQDPVAIYPDGHPNGRHRAHAAKKLGIKSIPVVVWPKKRDGGSVVDKALVLTSKKAKSRRGRPDNS